MLKFTSIVGYTSCGPTYIESVFTIFGQCINVLNYKCLYLQQMFLAPKMLCQQRMPKKRFGLNSDLGFVCFFCFFFAVKSVKCSTLYESIKDALFDIQPSHNINDISETRM